ncbi:MAG: DnaJ domain-containing protein [Candidatus Chisholmbacteria bacterium]|nr:DnaJ domain-containing protein [Candidatus Chisholmbacteria bacterium]
MPTKRDYYEILGVSKGATAAELKAAYRKKALEYHPDRNKAADAEEKFKEVNEAYEVLANPEKRQAYDQFGHAAFDPRSGFAGGGGFGQTRTGRAGPFTYTYTTSGFPGSWDFGDFSDPFEIFESFFGGASPFQRQPPRPRYELTIDFMEAMKGVEKPVVIRGKEYKIKIPPGADNGTRIRYGDFDVTVDVRPDSVFKRDGDDVFVNQQISFTQAALGGEIEVATIEGKLKLKVRPGTQPGTLVRLAGQGAPRLHARDRGDLYVRLVVEVPRDLTRRQKELLREFEEK